METLGTGATELRLFFQIASYRDITFTFTESDGTATDISLWTFEFFIKKYKGDRLKIISLTLGDGLSFPVYESNQVLVELTASQASIEEGGYYWELRRTDTSEPLIYGEAKFDFDGSAG